MVSFFASPVSFIQYYHSALVELRPKIEAKIINFRAKCDELELVPLYSSSAATLQLHTFVCELVCVHVNRLMVRCDSLGCLSHVYFGCS